MQGACLELSSICGHVPVGLGGRLLHLLHVLVARGARGLISRHQGCLANLEDQTHQVSWPMQAALIGPHTKEALPFLKDQAPGLPYVPALGM